MHIASEGDLQGTFVIFMYLLVHLHVKDLIFDFGNFYTFR